MQLPSRVFRKLTPRKNTGVDHNVYTSENDVVAKFRLFDTFEYTTLQD